MKHKEVTGKITRSTIGCDPEFFLKEKTTSKVIAAIGIIPGTKNEPHQMDSGAGLQVDNVAVEFASKPAANGDELIAHLRETFREMIKDYIPENHTLFLSPSAVLDDDQLTDPDALRFGCSPSYDAWDLIENPQPHADNPNLRSTGAHIHLGAVDGDGNDFLLDPMGKVFTVRALDCTLGIVDVLMDSSKEAIARRELYGKMGEHRPTSYGVEYRSLGPWWMSSPQTVMLIDSVAQDALRIVREGMLDEIVEALGGGDEIRRVINNADRKAAEKMLGIVSKHLSPESIGFLEDCLKIETPRELSVSWFNA